MGFDQQRVVALGCCWCAWHGLFRRFLGVRVSELWDVVRNEIETWIQMRKVAG